MKGIGQNLQASSLPLLARRGGPSDIKRYREATTSEAGWWVKIKRRILCWTLIHHPVCAAKVASQHFLSAHLPLMGQEGQVRCEQRICASSS